jgi:chromosomal replication initiation ATPase DnaA
MTGATRQLALALPHRPALGRADFLVGEANAAAVGWVDRWPDWPAPALTIHGPAASGKSHLATVWQLRTGAVAVLAADLPRLLAAEPLPPAVLLEAADGYVDGARAATTRPLLHLYNRLREAGGHLLLTARTPPARWTIAPADLRSRLVAAPAVAIGAPDDALLAAVAAKLFADRQLSVGADVISFLVRRIERSFAGLDRVVGALDAHAMESRAAITVPLAGEVLRRLEEQATG